MNPETNNIHAVIPHDVGVLQGVHSVLLIIKRDVGDL